MNPPSVVLGGIEWSVVPCVCLRENAGTASSVCQRQCWPEIKAQLITIRDAAGHEQGNQLVREFTKKYHRDFPSLVKTFDDDIDAALAHLELPFTHRKSARTTNLRKRTFEEERRRTKSFPPF